jgi:hypothetical protein
VGLLTIGCPGDDRLQDLREFSDRWNSASSNLLRDLFLSHLVVIQRHKDGVPHAHVVVVCNRKLGTGVYWDRQRRKWRQCPSAHCKALWDLLSPERMKGYGLGVANLLPLQGEANGLGRYVARYVSRELGTRRKGDRGARLVRYSQSWPRVVVGPFTWADKRAQRARDRAKQMAVVFWGSWLRMVTDIGDNWRFKLIRCLYCGDGEYWDVITYAERSLEFFGGILFALHDAWLVHDRNAELSAIEERRAIEERNAWEAIDDERRRGSATMGREESPVDALRT